MHWEGKERLREKGENGDRGSALHAVEKLSPCLEFSNPKSAGEDLLIETAANARVAASLAGNVHCAVQKEQRHA